MHALIGGLDVSKTALFDEQYLSTGGQLYELMAGRDRMLVDVRGLLFERFAREGMKLVMADVERERLEQAALGQFVAVTRRLVRAR